MNKLFSGIFKSSILCNKHTAFQISKHRGGRIHHKREQMSKVTQVHTNRHLDFSVCLLILPGEDRR